MTTTSTLKQIIEQVLEETGYGFSSGTLSSGSTTTAVLTTAGSSFLRGPFTGKRIPIGSPIIVTNTATAPTGVGDDSFVTNWEPSTGTITFSPAVSTTPTEISILYADSELDHFDRLIRCVKRAHDNRLMRWQIMPLTFVPDGDLRGTTVTDYWTGTAATPTYVTPTFPAGAAAAAFGFTGVQRVLQSVATNSTNRVTTNFIDVAFNSNTSAYQWYFQTAIRAVSAVGGSGVPQATIQARDETAGVPITINVIAGSDTFTTTTSSLGFVNMEGTLNVPTTCRQISFALVGGMSTTFGTSVTTQMTPLIAQPVDAMNYPIPNRIISEAYIGNFHYALQQSASSGLYSLDFTEPITTGGFTHKLQNYGDHLNVQFNFRPTRPVWFDELTYDPSLSAMTDSTTFPLDQVVMWTIAEIDRLLYERETRRRVGSDSQEKSQHLSRRIKIANASMKRAAYSEYEPELMKVYGRA